MAKNVLHVVPHNDGWAVRREGNERISSSHPTQKDAIESAREMAKELDDIVIHRPDGTIRERVTYYGSNDQPASETRTESRTVVRAEDRVPVFDRVSWGAIFAGAAAALAAYILLAVLALAIGVSFADQFRGRQLGVGAAVISGIILLVSMFVGGFVASRFTAGEKQTEAALYGVLVWGVVFLALVGGVGMVVGDMAAVRTMVPANNPQAESARVKSELGLTDDQALRYEALTRETRGFAPEGNPTNAAWWAFATVALSLLAAVTGGLLGAGPELGVRRAPNGEPIFAVWGPTT